MEAMGNSPETHKKQAQGLENGTVSGSILQRSIACRFFLFLRSFEFQQLRDLEFTGLKVWRLGNLEWGLGSSGLGFRVQCFKVW